ncbi:MAG: hypothetical protein EAZ97_14795, partial [Bacteroidetes bacterium]
MKLSEINCCQTKKNYDASLDAFRANSFDFNALDYNSLSLGWSASQNFSLIATQLKTYWNLPRLEVPSINYPALNTFGIALGNNYNRRYGRMMYDGAVGSAYEDDMAGSSGDEAESPQIVRNMRKEASVERALPISSTSEEVFSISEEEPNIQSKSKPKSNLDQVKARTNLNETAFFYPNLQTDSEGNLVIDFQMPEALTRWKMLGFAHTTDLKYGFTQKELITQKELMVVPNQPRFFREND